MKKNKFPFKQSRFLKIIIIVMIIAIFNLFNISSVLASSWANLANGTSVMDEILDNLGVNKAELKYGVQTMNVSRRKKTPPGVSVVFTPLNPSEGQKITATATPTYFLNDVKDLYFTWFLKSKDCPKDDNPSLTEKKKCDLNGDGKVNIADYKIKAMRIIVNNGFDWEKADYSTDNDTDGYKAYYGGNDQRGKKSYCYIHDTESGDEYKIGCDHLFPHAPGEVTGDNSFRKSEEKFWHTDVNSADTAGTGNVDEANVAGLGINTFTWNYESGDEVGVVVEGVSIEPSQTSDASFRTMWAMPVKMCDVAITINDYPKKSTQTLSIVNDSPNVGETTTTTQTTTQSIDSRAANIATIKTEVETTIKVTDSSTGSVISSSTTSTTPTYTTTDISSSIDVSNIDNADDLNDCLYDNLIDPEKSDAQKNKLAINLSYSPQTPMNDPNGDDKGDELMITSDILNAKDKTYLHYSWEVYESDEANPDSWGSSLTKSQLSDPSQTTGIGLDTFKFKLNFTNPKKYLRVKLTVTENNNSSAKEDYADIVIPLNSSDDNIQIYPVTVDSNNKLSLKTTNGEICSSSEDKIICPVVKNEIIGLKVDDAKLTDFSWKVDGKTLSCFSDNTDCQNNNQSNIAYFPILKNKGENYVLNLNALDQATGQKISLSRTFIVINPSVKIISDDENVCKPLVLGQYIGLNGIRYDDKSKINFQAVNNKDIKLKIDTTGIFDDNQKYVWAINGVVVNNNNSYGATISSDNKTITLPAGDVGKNYDISVASIYSQSDLVKQALNKYWKVSYNQFYEKPFSATIHIDVVDNLIAIVKNQTKKKKIMANIYSAMPNYLNFLLKLVLTSGLLLFGSKFILSLASGEKNKSVK